MQGGNFCALSKESEVQMKKLVSVLLTFAAMIGVTCTAAGINVGQVYAEEASMREFEALSLAQADAREAADIFYDNFLIEAYPDDYGGEYIKNNILHINIVDLDNADITRYQTALKGFEDVVVFESVEHSYNTLLSTAEEIADQLMDAGISVVSWGPGTIENKVCIDIEEESLAKLDLCSTRDSDECYTLRENPYNVPVTFEVSKPICPYSSSEATMSASSINLVGGQPIGIFNGVNDEGSYDVSFCNVGLCGTYKGGVR